MAIHYSVPDPGKALYLRLGNTNWYALAAPELITMKVPTGVIRTQSSDYHTAGGAVENNCYHIELDGNVTEEFDLTYESQTGEAFSIKCDIRVYEGKKCILWPGKNTVKGATREQTLKYKGVSKTFTDLASVTLSHYEDGFRVDWLQSIQGHSSANDLISWTRTLTCWYYSSPDRSFTVKTKDVFSFEDAPPTFHVKPDDAAWSTTSLKKIAASAKLRPLKPFSIGCSDVPNSVCWTDEMLKCSIDAEEQNYNDVAKQMQKFSSNGLAYVNDAINAKDLFAPVVQLVASRGNSLLKPQWWASAYLSYHYGWRLTVKDSLELKDALVSERVGLIQTDQHVKMDIKNEKWERIRSLTGAPKEEAYRTLLPEERIGCALYNIARDSSLFLPALGSVFMAAHKNFPYATTCVRSRHSSGGSDRYGDFSITRNLTCHVSCNPQSNINNLWKQFLYRWDLMCSAENCWDLVPFSFVLDWFTDFTQGFTSYESQRAFDIFPILYLIDTIKLSRNVSGLVSKGDKNVEWDLTYRKYIRSVLDGSINGSRITIPKSFPAEVHLPDSRHIKEGVALIVSKL